MCTSQENDPKICLIFGKNYGDENFLRKHHTAATQLYFILGDLPEVCCVCGKECDFIQDEICEGCSKTLHRDCSALHVTSDNTLEFRCPVCNRKRDITNKRAEAHKNLAQQAEYMKRLSNKRQKLIVVGDTVAVPVPEVDRAKSDPHNVLARVQEINEETMMYTLGTKSGMVENKYIRSQLIPCKKRLLEESDIKTDKILPIRTLATNQSVSGRGQGMIRCNCKSGCKIEKPGNCKCLKLKRKCNSRCHQQLSCHNKD